MSAREISRFTGDFQQTGADTYSELQLPIVSNGRRAIQLYKVCLDLDAHEVANSAALSSVTVGLYEAMDPAVDESAIVSFGASIAALGSMQTTVDWLAPPGLILGRNKLVLFIDSTATGRSQLVRYQIYYKPVTISDVQAVQLTRV